MRFVVLGAGAIGGLIGARLYEHGYEVVLVARGAHYETLRDRGLRVESPDGTVTLRIPTVHHLTALQYSSADRILLATKSQHTEDALRSLSGRAPPDAPIVCIQNGVENERLALRRFEHVYGVCVMCPASHLEPGVVRAHRAPVAGILDVGRYPGAVDDTARELASAFGSSGFQSDAKPDIMRWKYKKLLLNLGNAIEAICGPTTRGGTIYQRAYQEGVACLDAAGIAFASDAEDAARRADVVPRPPGGKPRGGSSWQSLTRQTGNVETDYLNGEIALLGRLHGVPTPVNDLLQRLTNDLARARTPPATVTETDLVKLLS